MEAQQPIIEMKPMATLVENAILEEKLEAPFINSQFKDTSLTPEELRFLGSWGKKEENRLFWKVRPP
jgi:hypothetical protein